MLLALYVLEIFREKMIASYYLNATIASTKSAYNHGFRINPHVHTAEIIFV